MRDFTYRQDGDYLVPNLAIDASTTPLIGKYGRMRRSFLMNHRSIIYNELVLTGKLYDHLYEIDAAAKTRLDTIVPRLMQDVGITEMLKAQNQLEWVRKMNVIKAQAEEIIANELVCC